MCNENNKQQNELLLLSVEEFNSKIAIEFFNNSSETIRVWEHSNSWGWNSVFVQVQNGDKTYQIKRIQDRDWTRNFPSFLEILPNNSWTQVVDLSDGWWDIPDDLKQTLKNSIKFKIKFQVEKTPESTENGIFVGEIESESQVSLPPHKWLMNTQ